MKRHLRSLLFLLTCSLTLLARAADFVEIHPGDHICLIGNTLADRMQHSGWLETLIYTRYPKANLVVRDLGFSGDELTIRQRSAEFGTPDEWLTHEKADVIFAFFGYNESFKGKAGLEQFRKDLDAFIKHTLQQNYSDKGAPRLVLFSPIAQQKWTGPAYPDPTAANERIQMYTAAMTEVAKANNVPFVDLFVVSPQIYGESKEALTINGIHLTEAGYKAFAPAMYRGLFNETAPSMDTAAFEKLRSAVNEKNWQFFERYRTVDGYNVYGGRSLLKFDGIMNRDTMQREMSMRDVMTANRDARVWAVAQGGDLIVKDDNLPPPIEVKSNKPGPNPDGTFTFLSGEEAISHMKLPPGCKVNLFASEEQFPELVNPVQMAWDTKGRLWVAVWPNYPERTPQSKMGDSLLVFEDTNGDGKADKCTKFLTDLNCPTGFQFYKDGVIVVQAPDVWFVRDTNGDGKADWMERILDGMDSADSHHTANALVLDPGGAIYLSDGVFHRTQVETTRGPVRNIDAAIYRFEPRTSKFERYISYGFANPHGRVFDYWGNDLVTDATGNNTYFAPAFSGYIPFPDKHPSMKQFWDRPSRPCPGTGILSSRAFPAEFQGNFLNCNVIGFQGIYRVKVTEKGSGLQGETIEPALVQSDDPNFRPSSVDVAPDGSVYFLDWHNPIIGHMQHHLRDPSRDHSHGRIYRITYNGIPLLKPAPVAGQPIPKLLELLKTPENDVRTRAKIELGARETKEVIAALQKWTKQFDPKKMEDQHALTEALWVYQWHDVVNEPLLRQQLQSPDFHARTAAVRVLCYWRDRVKDPLALLLVAANDASPRVRLEAVRAASFFEGTAAMDVAYASLNYETDYYLDYVYGETVKTLQKTLSQPYLPKDSKTLAIVVGRLSDKELAAAPDNEVVAHERLVRKSSDINARSAGLDYLATLHKVSRPAEALAVLQELDAAPFPAATGYNLGMLLSANTPADLNPLRPALNKLATSAKQASVRRAAYAALVTADAKPDAVWAGTASSPENRIALIESVSLLTDPDFRALFEPLLTGVIDDSKSPENVRSAAVTALPLMGNDLAAKNFGILAKLLESGNDLPLAARATMQIPRVSWNKEAAGPVTEKILAWARQVPTGKRTEQGYVETVQLGMELATLLPPADNTRIRKELLGLGVRVFAIKTVREQMRYDTTRIVVEAGKPFQIIFENTDMMPHNLVILQPGAREEVGTQAQTMQPTPDKQGRVFVPNNKKILAASKLVEPGMKDTIKLTAPKEPGNYEYICTYPEHWKVMFGQLVVVKDIDEFLKATADVPLPAAAPAGAMHHHH